MISRRTVCAAVLISLCLSLCEDSVLRAAPFEFQDGDRIVLLGSTFIERAQRYGYIEAELTAALAGQKKHVTFRNLGWSGDTVWAESRGIFDAPVEGYKRMIEQIKGLEPTVIIFYYGANEAYGGESGLPPFLKQYNKLLDDLKSTKARFVLISPLDHLQFSDRHPDPADYNANAKMYRDAIETLAEERNAGFVDLTGSLGTKLPLGTPNEPIAVPARLMSDTGVHLNAFGYKTIAQILRHQLIGPTIIKNWELKLGDDQTAPTTLNLPHVLIPGPLRPTAVLKVGGLDEGRYGIIVNGQNSLTVSAPQLAEGIPLYPIDYEHYEELRATIIKKNELYFYRWRPQNVTYLFLFRKHEQGNNAKEIPQFDPLIEVEEQKIQRLSQPSKYQVNILPENN